MFAICIEASHKKGMGHLFRMLNFAKYLEDQNEKFIFLINDNEKTKEILQTKKINYAVVLLEDLETNWESKIIEKYPIHYWINDRLDTSKKHAYHIINNHIKLITFDDLSSGARLSDINICGLFFNKSNLEGKKILKGIEYLILNDEINRYKKERFTIENIIVTLGGSDTYGVTIKVLKLLKKYNLKATIHIGPSFEYIDELKEELTEDFKLLSFIPSLIKEFNRYDLAITGGGLTAFEANASGLPCLIIANELFEVPNAEFLESMNTSKFLGYHENFNESMFKNIDKLNINEMSKQGLLNLDTKAVYRVYEEIKK
jgi:spore coat polysaccharide biosynthesis predicted glycosyltransferase SpsG